VTVVKTFLSFTEDYGLASEYGASDRDTKKPLSRERNGLESEMLALPVCGSAFFLLNR